MGSMDACYHEVMQKFVVVEHDHRSFQEVDEQLIVHEIDVHVRSLVILVGQGNGEPEHSLDDQMIVVNLRSSAFVLNVEVILG